MKLYMTAPIFTNLIITRLQSKTKFDLKGEQSDGLIFESSCNNSPVLINDVIINKTTTIFSNEITKLVNDTASEVNKPLVIKSVNFKLYNDGIVYFILGIEINSELEVKKDEFDKVERIASKLGEKLFIKLIETHVMYELNSLVEKSICKYEYNDFLMNAKEKNIYNSDYSMCGLKIRVLWIGRTLILKQQQLSYKKDILKYWLPGYEEKHEKMLDVENIIVGWGNNLSFTSCEEQLSDLLDMTSICDYFSACIYLSDLNLNEIMKNTNYTGSIKDIRELLICLQETIEYSSKIIISYYDLENYSSAVRQKYYRTFHEIWKFENVILNLDRKILYAQRKANMIYETMTAKSQQNREVILALIAGLSVISLLLSISQFGKADDSIDDVIGILDIGRSTSPDALVWSGFLMVIMFIVYYLVTYRKR